jgi:hypothetical protein
MQVNAIFNGRVATAFVMMLIFVTMSLMALGFPEKARLMPLMVGIPGSVLGLIQLIAEIRHSVPQSIQDAEVAELNRHLCWCSVSCTLAEKSPCRFP